MDLWEFSFTNALFLDGKYSKGLLSKLFELLIDFVFVPLPDFGLFFFKGRSYVLKGNFCFSTKIWSSIFELFLFLFPLEDNEDSLDKDESDSEEVVSSESLSDTKNSFLDFFFVDNLPKTCSFNERLREKIEKQKDKMLIEWTK